MDWWRTVLIKLRCRSASLVFFALPFIIDRRHCTNDRTRQDQVHLRNIAFKAQMEGMMDAYLNWFSALGDTGLANDKLTLSSCELQGKYNVEVLDTFGKDS